MKVDDSIRPLAAAGLAAIAWCIVVGGLASGDPMLIVEALAGSVTVAWGLLVVREVAVAARTERSLIPGAVSIDVRGVACNVTPALGADAVVIGTLWPRIYLGVDLVARMSKEELEAVVYHEDHHRATRAPLRAAALTGWLTLFGRAAPVRAVVLDRLADLETMADAEAIRRGATAGSLARALMKGGDRVGLTTAFSYAADRRVEELLAHADGSDHAASRRLPYEWLPVAMFAVSIVACHIGL